MREHEGAQLCNLRQQSAYANADEPLIIKVGNEYYRVERVWIDTAMAPVGKGIYLEAQERPIRR